MLTLRAWAKENLNMNFHVVLEFSYQIFAT
jgi:hypothetical protein